MYNTSITMAVDSIDQYGMKEKNYEEEQRKY